MPETRATPTAVGGDTAALNTVCARSCDDQCTALCVKYAEMLRCSCGCNARGHRQAAFCRNPASGPGQSSVVMPTRTPFLSGPSPVSSRAFHISEKRVSSNRLTGLSRRSQPAPLLSRHLLLGGELSDRETSGRVAVTVPADACGQRRIRSRTRKLPILPDRARESMQHPVRSPLSGVCSLSVRCPLSATRTFHPAHASTVRPECLPHTRRARPREPHSPLVTRAT